MVRCRRCGHPKDAHEHYRRGTDCALCECPKFSASPLSWVRRVRHPDGPARPDGSTAHRSAAALVNRI